ncbi:hypothetical protein JCM17845_20150 [Iodidimonas gelatinilytica]|uniref:Uncharacterized protein n=2 Tax=Iodidimonas gelatinilytica TaxID=1236966 RepID=A0A5A7MZF4_9PROT|nr:hypothetical protein [Iodidimonas gelatinilytica]GER01392.1 hypothetical protein JCM17845_20150 [Iodidimonas gelatinilytica]
MLQISGLARAFGLKRPMSLSGERHQLDVGDSFIESGNWENIWVVERIVQPRGVGFPHVVIRHHREKSERRLVSRSTLLDPDRFSPCM